MSVAVKILVCCHKPVSFPWDEVFTPVFAGHALYRDEIPEAFSRAAFFDDDGENISCKNPSYNELTAVYWAWKNYDKLGDPAYIGLTHYRRHLIFDERATREVVPFSAVTDSYFDEIGYPDGLFSLLKKYDFLYLNGRVKNVAKQFAENHDPKDLALAVSVLKRKHPTYAGAAKRFLCGDEGCFCNCFVFPKRIFFAYCEFLFPVLRAYEKKRAGTGRMFVSERLTGIFVRRLQEKGLRGAPLSSTLIAPPKKRTFCIPYDPARPFRALATLCSFLGRAGREEYYECFLLRQDRSDDVGIDAMKRRFPGHAFVSVCVPERLAEAGITPKADDVRLYPFLLGAILPEAERVLYLEAGTVAARRADDLFDDVYADEATFAGKSGTQIGGVFLGNASFLRENKRAQAVDALLRAGRTAEETREEMLRTGVRFFPVWRVCSSAEEQAGAQIRFYGGAYTGEYARLYAEAAAFVPLGVKEEDADVEETPVRKEKRSGAPLFLRAWRYVKRNGIRKTLARVKRELGKKV